MTKYKNMGIKTEIFYEKIDDMWTAKIIYSTKLGSTWVKQPEETYQAIQKSINAFIDDLKENGEFIFMEENINKSSN